LNVVIGGGDGTTIWVVESLIKAKIDILKCVIIPFPFGTGNDFSNSLGRKFNKL
jgi:diacylglycerol kinase (ATP)